MRYRATFIVGFAVGFVVGARAGRERYEQIKKASQKVAENPTVRRRPRPRAHKATELTKVAKDKAASGYPSSPRRRRAAPARCAASWTGYPAGTPPTASPRP